MTFYLEVPRPLHRNVIIHFFENLFPDDKEEILELNTLRNKYNYNDSKQTKASIKDTERWVQLWHKLVRKCETTSNLLTPFIMKFEWHSEVLLLHINKTVERKTTGKLSGETLMLSYHCATNLYNQAVTYLKGIKEKEKTRIDISFDDCFLVKLSNNNTLSMLNQLIRKKTIRTIFTDLGKEVFYLLGKSYWILQCSLSGMMMKQRNETKGYPIASHSSMWYDYIVYSSLPLLLIQKIFTTSCLLNRTASVVMEQTYPNEKFGSVLLRNELWTCRELLNVTFVLNIKLTKDKKSALLDTKTAKKIVQGKLELVTYMKEVLDYAFRVHLCMCSYFMVCYIQTEHGEEMRKTPTLVSLLLKFMEKVEEYYRVYVNPSELDKKLTTTLIDVLDYCIFRSMGKRITQKIEEIKRQVPISENVELSEKVLDIRKAPYEFYDFIMDIHGKWMAQEQPEFTHVTFCKDFMSDIKNQVHALIK